MAECLLSVFPCSSALAYRYALDVMSSFLKTLWLGSSLLVVVCKLTSLGTNPKNDPRILWPRPQSTSRRWEWFQEGAHSVVRVILACLIVLGPRSQPV